MRRIGLLLVFVLLWLTVSPASALRCNSELVHEGDTKFELLKKCGEPVTREVVGYKLNRFGDRELKIEHLIYGPWSGWYYLIEIVGGEIYKIESFKDM